MCCINKGCCRRCCPEWTRPTLWPLLAVMTVSFTIFAVGTYGFLNVVFVRFVEQYSASFWMVLFFFSFWIMLLVVVYAPFQHQLFPLWYKILSVSWYVGYSLFIGIIWSFFPPFFREKMVQPMEEMFGIYFTPYSVGYLSTGFVWSWLMPHLMVVFGITFGFQMVQHIAFDQFQWYHWLYGSLASTLAIAIFMIVNKKSFCKEWPWISSAKTVSNKKAKWCCESWISRNVCTCCRQQERRTKKSSVSDLEFKITAAVKAQLFLFYIKSFPSFMAIFDDDSCISFLITSPWIDFVMVHILLLILVLPWIDPKVLTYPKYVVLHCIMSFIIGVIECLLLWYRLHAYFGEYDTYFVSDCLDINFGAMYYNIIGVTLTAVCCFIQWLYTMRLYITLNATGDNRDILTLYFSEWKRESVYPLLVIVGLICLIIVFIIQCVIAVDDTVHSEAIEWKVTCVGFALFYVFSLLIVYSPFQYQLYPLWYKIISFILFIFSCFLCVIDANHSVLFWCIFYVFSALFLSWNVPLNIGIFGIVWPVQAIIYFADLSFIFAPRGLKNDYSALNKLQIVYGLISSFVLILSGLIWSLVRNNTINIFKSNEFPILSARNNDSISNKEATCTCCCESFWYNRLCFCVEGIVATVDKIENLLTKSIKSRDKLMETLLSDDDDDDDLFSEMDINDLLHLITESEETEALAYNQLIKLAQKRFDLNDEKELIVDGDNAKSGHEMQPSLHFDNTTLERRLSDFDELVYTPSDLNDLISRMQSAVNSGSRIKAMGSRYAFSNITFTDKNGLLIDMYNSLNDPEMSIHSATLNDYGGAIHKERNMHLCQAGTSFEMILETLWPEKERRTLVNKSTGFKYKALRDVTGYNQLSIGGVISTASSGTGTPFIKANDADNYGSLVNQVLAYSMLIIDDDNRVRLVQIEASVGNGAIHDLDKWREEFADIELIQNDDIFEAGLVSFGLLGVIYSYYLLLEDAHFILEHRHMESFKEFRDSGWKKLEKEIKNDEMCRLMVMLSPYTTLDRRFVDSPPLLIQTYHKTSEIPPKHFHIFNVGAQVTPGWMVRVTAALSNWMSRILPEIIPFTTQMILQSTDLGDIVRPSFESYSLGTANAVPTKANAFAFKYSESLFFNFLDDYVRLMNQIRYNDRNQISVLPLAIRFSSYKSKGLLNIFNHDDDGDGNGYFWVEFIVPNFEGAQQGVTATIENNDGMLKQLQSFCMNEKYGGVPHFGLILKDINANIFKTFDQNKVKKFIEIYKKYNKTKTFSNQFTNQSGLDDMAKL